MVVPVKLRNVTGCLSTWMWRLMPVPPIGVADRRRSEGLPDALDPDCRHALRLAQGLRVRLVIVHPANSTKRSL